MDKTYLLASIPGKTFSREELVEIWNRLIACEWDNRVGFCPAWWGDVEATAYASQALAPIITEIELLTSEYERSCYANTVMNGMRRQTFDRLWRTRLASLMKDRVKGGASFSTPIILHQKAT